jgi:glycosyltransferase involved in cell wall biosynthesis
LLPVQVVEPTLESYSGHCHSLVTSLCQSLGSRPIDLWSATGAQGMNFGSHVTNHPGFRRRIRLVQALLLYRRLLRGGAPIVVTTARRSDLVSLDLIARGPLPRNRVFLYFHWLRESAAKLRSFRKLAQRQPHVVIFGTTASVVDFFKRCGFANVFLLPYPSPPASTGGEAVPFRQLLYAGAARQDKGFSLIADLVELLAREGAHMPVAVQVSADHYGKIDVKTREDIARLEAAGYAPLELKSQTLTPEEYSALFPGSICLQPYNRDEFRDRVSGVTLDALAHACPVVATAGTWSADLIKPFGAGVELHAMNAASLLQAARKIEQDYTVFQSGARAAGQAQNRKSWVPLLELLPDAAAG